MNAATSFEVCTGRFGVVVKAALGDETYSAMSKNGSPARVTCTNKWGEARYPMMTNANKTLWDAIAKEAVKLSAKAS
jgi:hypothetical protein